MHNPKITSAQYVEATNPDNTTQRCGVKAVIDGVTLEVPMDTANRHYQAILDWVAEGNSIADAS